MRGSGPFQPAPVTSAARTARWYARRKAGRSVYRLELDTAAVEDMLVAAGLVVAAFSSMHVSSAVAQSVYVAPGGVYVGGGPVYVNLRSFRCGPATAWTTGTKDVSGRLLGSSTAKARRADRSSARS